MSGSNRAVVVSLAVVLLLVLGLALLLPNLGAARKLSRDASLASDVRQTSLEWHAGLNAVQLASDRRATNAVTSGGFESTAPPARGKMPDVASPSRMIARHAQLSVRVESVGDFVADLSAMAESVGGYVTEASHSPGHGRRGTGSITVSVPSDRLENVLGDVRDTVDAVEHEKIEAEDVTDTVVDLDARLTNLRAAETRLRDLLGEMQAKDDSADAIIQVFRELTRLREEIERLEASRRSLAERVRYATLRVRVLGPEAPATAVADPEMGPDDMWGYATSTLNASLRWLLNAAIFAGVVVVPLAAVVFVPLAVLVWVGRKLVARPTESGAG